MAFFHQAFEREHKPRAGVNLTKDGRLHPQITYSAQEPQYGMLTFNLKDSNNLRAVRMYAQPSIDSFNQGCINSHGCVNNTGFTCMGSKASPSQEKHLKNDLNMSYAPDNFDMKIPSRISRSI